MTLFLFVIGLGLLFLGGDFLVRGAANLASTLGISRVVVGLTVVAFSTSAPELAVSLQAALAGRRTWPLATWWGATSPTSS